MALAVNDILQITDVQSFLGQTVLNVFFYEVLTLESLTDYDDIQGAFKLKVVDRMRVLQSTSLLHTRIIVKNLTNEIDIHEEPYDLAGEMEGDPLPSTNALSIRLVRSTAVTRHGSKRVAGLTEVAVSGNELVSTYLDEAADIANEMADDLEITGTVDHDFTAQPVIVGRVHIPAANAGELDLRVINPIASGQYIRLSTQTTRRAGRGI